jgi:sulfonate transport system permease protein
VPFTKYKKHLISVLLPLIILALWSFATSRALFSPAILPPVSQVIQAFQHLIQTGQLLQDVLISLSRVVKGYLIAVVLGITMGTLMGTSKTLDHFFSLTLNAIRQIPMLAWIPLIILWFGIGESSKIAVIVLGAYFPILLNTMSGIRNTPKGFIEVARLYQLSRWETFRKVYLPSALPQIFVGLKLGLGISWVAVVASELIAASSGIGFRISDARSLMMPDVVIVGMIVIGVIGISMDKLLTLVFTKVTPWGQTK